MDSTFRVRVRLTQEGDAQAFFAWAWSEFPDLLGVHEGTVLSERAAELGLETESFTVDAALAPRERDWISASPSVESELYFGSQESAESAAKELRRRSDVLSIEVEEQKPEDWDARWKQSFTGAEVPPFWSILPPWMASEGAGRKILRINPGAGFGTGTHETTQLCLRILGERFQAGYRPKRVLDFGSGSGILAIGAALLGAQERVEVDAVEIDPLANENAAENARLNGIEGRIRFLESLPSDIPAGGYDLVFANILKPVLLEFRDQLTRRRSPRGVLIVSGLVEDDVAPVKEAYRPLVGEPAAVRELGEWRAIEWR